MSNSFNCEVCDKTIKIESEKKHLNSQYQKSLSTSVVFRYSVSKPDFIHIENTLKNYVLDYYKKFEFYLIICKWKFHFLDTFVNVKSNTWYSVSGGYYLKTFFLSKNE